MNITVEIKQVYGKDTIFPVCKKAQLFADMVGQRMLTTRDINYIKMLGYEIKVEAPTL